MCSGEPSASRDPVLELVHVEAGGVDDEVGVAAQRGHHLALAVDARRAAGRRPAAGAADGRPPAGGPGRRRWPRGRAASYAGRGRRARALLQGPEEGPGPHVDHHGDRLGGAPAARRPAGPRRRPARAAGCRRRSSRGPPAPWPRCCGRRRSCRSRRPARPARRCSRRRRSALISPPRSRRSRCSTRQSCGAVGAAATASAIAVGGAGADARAPRRSPRRSRRGAS